MLKLLYGVKEACEEIHHGRTRLYKLIGEGRVRAVKAGSRTLIDGQSLAEYVAGLPTAEVAIGRKRGADDSHPGKQGRRHER